MKKFIGVVAVIAVALLTMVIMDYKAVEAWSLSVGFFCGMCPIIRVVQKGPFTFREAFYFGIGMGFILSIVFGFGAGSETVALYSFLGSIIGSIIGHRHPKKVSSNKTAVRLQHS